MFASTGQFALRANTLENSSRAVFVRSIHSSFTCSCSFTWMMVLAEHLVLPRRLAACLLPVFFLLLCSSGMLGSLCVSMHICKPHGFFSEVLGSSLVFSM